MVPGTGTLAADCGEGWDLWFMHGSVSSCMDWDIWRSDQSPGLFVMFLNPSLNKICGGSGCIVLLGEPLPSGMTAAMRGFTKAKSGWVLRVKEHSHECQNPKITTGTFHGSKMINVEL